MTPKTPSSLKRLLGRPQSVLSSLLVGAVVLNGSRLCQRNSWREESRREGQETGPSEGGGGQLHGEGAARGAVPASQGPGWWAVASGNAYWGRPAPPTPVAEPSWEPCPLSEDKPGAQAAGAAVPPTRAPGAPDDWPQEREQSKEESQPLWAASSPQASVHAVPSPVTPFLLNRLPPFLLLLYIKTTMRVLFKISNEQRLQCLIMFDFRKCYTGAKMTCIIGLCTDVPFWRATRQNASEPLTMFRPCIV